MPEIAQNTEVRLIRAHIGRLARSIDGAYQLYYHTDNSKEYHGNDLNFLEVDEDTVDIINRLFHAYPNYVRVGGLSDDHEAALAVVYALWDRGMLMTSAPLA